MADGNNTVNGGAGIDTLSYERSVSNLTIDISSAASQNNDIGSDTILNFENLYGGFGDDNLTGDSQDNILYGGPDGADTLIGGSGTDTFIVNFDKRDNDLNDVTLPDIVPGETIRFIQLRDCTDDGLIDAIDLDCEVVEIIQLDANTLEIDLDMPKVVIIENLPDASIYSTWSDIKAAFNIEFIVAE